ncbi:ribosomal RNA large subunit methyltransferase H [Thermaurantimonas aggregans]|uniref:Ribosomal RNA large subunit methyltransferase H n=1 Tax=Thermaurantimonas aggregans TaxID=2173829 RepID=A0A401XIU8_9FLAO|nr:23S rRNA (pseudouridine(1915)-N(3))-methyltransferase RlmH [Thermaurantimonas aggregans]MCX8149801.1 23S rRNA (pseudouridine(1915)-N(3))-methyltransferase RlmH [Thermaurantimonas aggregans]GCD76918.1 ribosomal RNA large subunit methyltransferase H [Thermaurantimonas aggregans]
MKISLLTIGKSNISYVNEAETYYLPRLRHYTRFEYLKQEPKKVANADITSVQKAEMELILRESEGSDCLILFDERGKLLSSRELAALIGQLQNNSVRHSLWVIGGAYGFHSDLYSKAKKIISLSKLTFSHQLVRVIVLEQFYRAFTILHNHPYHHD